MDFQWFSLTFSGLSWIFHRFSKSCGQDFRRLAGGSGAPAVVRGVVEQDAWPAGSKWDTQAQNLALDPSKTRAFPSFSRLFQGFVMIFQGFCKSFSRVFEVFGPTLGRSWVGAPTGALPTALRPPAGASHGDGAAARIGQAHARRAHAAGIRRLRG